MKTLALWLAPFWLASLFAPPVSAQTSSYGLAAPDRADVVLHRSHAVVSQEPAAAESSSSFPALAPRPSESADSGDSKGKSGMEELAGPAITVTSSLAVVLGLFAGLVWVTRKFGYRSMGQGAIPKEVFQNLGSTPLDARTRVTMVRCGARILIMAQTVNGVQPLAEISDPDEVRELTAACLGNSKHAFDTALRSIEQEKADPGYAGTSNPRPAGSRSKGGRLFATA